MKARILFLLGNASVRFFKYNILGVNIMVKGVSPSVLRNTALCLLLAGSMSVAAANMNKNNSYVTEPNQTELISKEGAEALKINNFQAVTQSEVPTVHLPNLDATIRKFIEDENDRKDINELIGYVSLSD